MKVNGVEVKVGQVWETLRGYDVIISRSEDNATYPWKATFDDESFEEFNDDNVTYWNEVNKLLDKLVKDATMEEKTYTEAEIRKTLDALRWYDADKFMIVIEEIKTKHDNPEYKEYLRLKEKFGET